jgi:hypothetical protein
MQKEPITVKDILLIIFVILSIGFLILLLFSKLRYLSFNFSIDKTINNLIQEKDNNLVEETIVLNRCSDSDGGFNIYEQGTVDSWDNESRNDQCFKGILISEIEGQYNQVDSCMGLECYIQEAACLYNGNLGNQMVSCPDGCSNGACTVNSTTPTISILSPSDYGTFVAGDEILFQWTSENVSSPVFITLLENGDFGKEIALSEGTPNDGSLTVNLPFDLTGKYKVQIIGNNGNLIKGVSDGFITIFPKAR